MRHRIVGVCVLLVLGALITAGVSTACAVWSGRDDFYDIHFDTFDPPALSDDDLGRVADRPLGVHESWTTGELRTFGYWRREYFRVDSRIRWGSGGYTSDLAWTRCGWPWYAAESTDTLVANSPMELREYSGAIVVTVEVDIGGPVPFDRPIPIGPLWAGFAADSCFFAAVLWALFVAPRGTLRFVRRRRGLCARCGYPRGTAERCSECGKRFRLTGSSRHGRT